MEKIANQINYYPGVQSSNELDKPGHIKGYQDSNPFNGNREIYSSIQKCSKCLVFKTPKHSISRDS